MRVWWLHQPTYRTYVAHLRNARRLRVLRILVGRGGCFGKEMLDACTQVGWELQEAHWHVETTLGRLNSLAADIETFVGNLHTMTYAW